jgi:DNA-binding transcriptional LysR family regulator
VRLTEAGLKILERARSMLRDVRDLRAIAQDSSLPGELRLGVFSSAMVSVLPALLQRLYRLHPELAVFVAPGSSVQLCSRVSSGELDAAIVVEPPFAVPKNCDWVALAEEPLVVVAHARHAGREPHALLAEEPFIRYDRVSAGGQIADRYLRDHGIRVRQRLEIDSLLVAAALVGQGLGVALLPDWPWLWTSGMAITRIPLPVAHPPVRRVGLVYALQGPCVPLSRVVLAQARETLAAGPEGETARAREQVRDSTPPLSLRA